MNENKKAAVFQIIIPLNIAIALSALLIIGSGQAASTAVRATFTVNSFDDADDGSCDGVHCSLREAIDAANAANGADIIDFSLPPTSTITLIGNQLPLITDTLTIDGGTAVSLTITGADLTRTFQITNGTAVTLTSLTLEDGHAVNGGAVYNDGGQLTLEDMVIRDNTADFGGGIYNNAGILTITNSVIKNNFVEVEAGGGIYNSENSTATIRNTVFFDNLVDPLPSGVVVYGGGIYNDGTLAVIDSTFTDNKAIADANPVSPPVFFNAAYGGGIYNSGILDVYNSTFSGNFILASAPYFTTHSPNSGYQYYAYGGGINNVGVMTVSNSTFSGNHAFSALSFQSTAVSGDILARGGGIYNNGSATMTLINSTFSGNQTTLYPWGEGGGGSLYNGGDIQMINTLIANSEDSVDCVNFGSIAPNVNNLVEDGSCNPDLTGEPLLYPLQDNGGSTPTHALSGLSIAVDSGDNGTCAAAPVNNLDQRGVVRPLDGDGDGTAVCDIGAFEYDGPPPFHSYLPIVLKN